MSLASLEAKALLDSLTEKGVTLTATKEGKLKFSPRSLLSSVDVERLKLHKTDLLNLLAKEYVASPPSPSVPQGDKAENYGDLGGTHRGDATGDACAPPLYESGSSA